MMDPHLRASLKPVLRRLWNVQLGWRLALSWSFMALLGLGLLALRGVGVGLPTRTLPALALVGLFAVLIIAGRLRRIEPDWRRLARRIETRFPDLDGLLLTAVQQPAADEAPRNYLQERLVRAALVRSTRQPWQRAIHPWRIALAQTAHIIALAAFGLVLWGLLLPVSPSRASVRSVLPASGTSVLPGDIRLERGSSLVVLARLGATTLRLVELVVRESGETPQRLPMVRSLGEALYGARLAEVNRDLVYSVEYDGRRTREFRVTVYEHPRLERADASLTYPPYTGEAPRRIEDTRRLSAVEGTTLELGLQLNKPVAAARLLPRDPSQPALSLRVDTNRPVATLGPLPLAASGVYHLLLTDRDGLTNKQAAQFTFDVLPNRTPEFRLTGPRGDLRPSALEEIPFTGTVWDDFGVEAFGIAYARAGEPPRFLELGHALPGREKHPFEHLLRLEDLDAKPDELFTWFTWTDDLAPDGQIRRTLGDLFFAEVRPFDEVFREGDDSGSGESGQSGESGEQDGNRPGNLAELQKQVLSATWKLQRDPRSPVALTPPAGPTSALATLRTNAPANYRDNATVVRDAQALVLETAESARDLAGENAEKALLWSGATTQMELALQRLNVALDKPEAIAEAVPPEQAAYQALLRLQEREFAVSRRRNSRGQGSSSRNQAMQRQLDQLDLTRQENRYETERQAQAPDSPERREELQILNRLQELARRQQDVNDQLRELQTALQEARSETEREEIQRRLQRLQEEERRMLADLDELQQRLNRPENQSRMMDQSRRLESTRDNLQRATEAATEGNASQALAAGTRAQRELQEMREELRRQTSSAFADDLREMRTQARELARQEQAINEALDNLTDPRRRTLGDEAERREILRQLEPQKERLQDLVEDTTELSRQAEPSEPLVARELYDALRQFSQNEAKIAREFQEELIERGLMTRGLYERLNETSTNANTRSLELTEELLRLSQVPIAQRAEDRARSGIGELTRGVERAAERVLGDDAEALRRARQELDRLTDQVEREMAQAEPLDPGIPSLAPTSEAPSDRPRQPGEGETVADRRPESAERRAQEGSRDAGGRALNRNPADGATGSEPGRRGSPDDDSPLGRAARLGLDSILDESGAGGAGGTGPITGPEFTPWSDRLREVEEMVDLPELRDGIATARERARQFRQDYRRNLKKPDWAVVRLEVVRPLVEVRNRIAEELARRQPQTALVPLDRDPVPGRFAELVRRYYEELGKGRGPDAAAGLPRSPNQDAQAQPAAELPRKP